LERIGATIEQKWGSEREDRKEDSSNEEGESKNGPRESQEEGTPSSTFC